MLNSNWVHPRPRDEVLNRLGEDPSAIERGLTVLEMDVPLLEGVTLDLLAVDAEGRPVGVLAGELDEDALLVRGLDVLRTWRVVGHLMCRIYNGEGFRFEEPLRLILLAQRFTQRLRDVVRLLRGLSLDLREYRVVVADGHRVPVVSDSPGTVAGSVRQPGPVGGRLPGSCSPGPEGDERLAPGGEGMVRAMVEPTDPIGFERLAERAADGPAERPTERVSARFGPAGRHSAPDDPSPEAPLHRLYQEARGKILRIGEEIEEEARQDSCLFLVAGSVLAELSLGPDGLVGRLGADDESSESATVRDRRAMDAFLNRVFRFYFDLTADPVESSTSGPRARKPEERAGRNTRKRVE